MTEHVWGLEKKSKKSVKLWYIFLKIPWRNRKKNNGNGIKQWNYEKIKLNMTCCLPTCVAIYKYSGFVFRHMEEFISHPFEVRVYDFIRPIEHKQKWYVSIPDRSLKTQCMLNHPLLLYPRNNGHSVSLNPRLKKTSIWITVF